MKNFRQELLSYFESTEPDLIREIEEKCELTEEVENKIKDTVVKFKSR